MAHRDFTKHTAEAAEPGVGRAAPMGALAVERLKRSAFVGGVAGLQLKVSASGAKSWRLFYRLPGDARRRAMKLGGFPDLGLSDARTRARAELKRAGVGEDPKAARFERAQQSAVTVDAALDAYLAHCVRENSKATVADKMRAFRKHVRLHIGRRVLARMKRADWLSVIEAETVSPSMRRSLWMYIRHFLAWAMEREHIETHPLWGVRPPKRGASRDRILSDDEIRALWAIEGETPDLARLSLLTGQRQGSLAHMQWPQLDLHRGLWAIPAENMKSGKPHVAPLSPAAVAILQRRCAQRFDGPYVFGVKSNGARPYDGFSNGMEWLRLRLAGEPSQQGRRLSAEYKSDRRLRQKLHLPNAWRFHDLRRTAVTLAQRGGAHIDAIKALTQHKTAGVIGIYARHAFHEEKVDVAHRIEAQVLSVLEAQTSPQNASAISLARTVRQLSASKTLRLPEVSRRTGLSRYSIYAALAKGAFPAPIRVGARGVAWREADLDAWIAQRPPQR